MATPPTRLPPIPDDFEDHKYATKHGVPLWLRVWPAPPASTSEAAVNKGRPWLFWVHGGAYCSGQHYQLRTWLLHLTHKYGIHVVSVAHRFVPHVLMEEMLDDCDDAFHWCRAQLKGQLESRGGVDIETFGVGGDSSGGGLATLLPFRAAFKPSPAIRPRAVLNVYGTCDLLAQQVYYDGLPDNPQQWTGTISEDEVKAIVACRDAEKAMTVSTNFWNLVGLDPKYSSQDPDEIAIAQGSEEVIMGLKKMWKVSDDEWRYDRRTIDQWDVKGYMSHKRLMVSLALRIEKWMSEDDKKGSMKMYSAYHLLDDVGEKGYPPTAFLHGTGDSAVPFDISKRFAGKLRGIGVAVRESWVEGTEHGWDNAYVNEQVEGWDEVIEPIGKFLSEHLSS